MTIGVDYTSTNSQLETINRYQTLVDDLGKLGYNSPIDNATRENFIKNFFGEEIYKIIIFLLNFKNNI